MNLRLHSLLSGLALVTLCAPATAQQSPVKPVPTISAAGRDAPLVRPTPEAVARRLSAVRAATVARQGGETVQAQAARLRTGKATIAQLRSRPPLLQPQAGGPAITLVNNKASGVIEPGGGYQIVGRGFGNFPGTPNDLNYSNGGYFVQFEHPSPRYPETSQPDPGLRSWNMRVISWTDQAIYAEMPDNLQGLPDADRVVLRLKSPGKSVESRAFGYRAIRAEASLANIPRDAFQPDHITSANYRNVGSKAEASRWSETTNLTVPCFSPGKDRYRLDHIPLKPGFWINRVDFCFEPPKSDVSNAPLTEWRETGFGKYAARFEGDELVIDWGVQRVRTKDRLGGGKATCESAYSLTFYATGPKGLPAQ